MLDSYGFPGDDIPIVRGSALHALTSTSTDPAAPVRPIWELMRVVDEYIPLPQRDLDKPFLMPVEDVFSIKGRSTVVTGRIERNTVKTGRNRDRRYPRPWRVVTGVEMFQKTLEKGEAGDNVRLSAARREP